MRYYKLQRITMDRSNILIFKDRTQLQAPGAPVLVHVCCGPCAGEIVEALIFSRIAMTLFFYNPNIDSSGEYQKRKETLLGLADYYHVKVLDGDYAPEVWQREIAGYENSPERGERCLRCYRLRLAKTAELANAHQYRVFTSTLGISRWKPFESITALGSECAKGYANLIYWPYNWRKCGGSDRMGKIARSHQLYQQTYCGCIYSRQEAL